MASSSSRSYPSPMLCRFPPSLSCFLLLPVILCPPLPAVEIVLPPMIHLTSSCSWGWGWVVVLSVSVGHCGGALVLVFGIVIPFGGISACFRGVSGDVAGYGVRRAHTWQVSSSRSLPVSPCILLVHIDNLTSCLNGEEGVALSLLGGGCTALVPFVSCSLVPRNK